MNEIIYFTITALLLYVAADKILLTVEKLRGGHFKNRSTIFFGIILALSLGTFQILQHFLPKQSAAPEAETTAQPQEVTPPGQPQEARATEAEPAEEPRVSSPPTVE
jgi:hypothetical protein